MRVEKRSQVKDPGYPSRKQFADGRLLAGIAAIGLGAAVGRGEEPRLLGDIAVEPRGTHAAPVEPKPVRLPGSMLRVAPRAGAGTTNAPAASTNQVPVAAQPAKPAQPARPPDAADGFRTLGRMPVTPK